MRTLGLVVALAAVFGLAGSAGGGIYVPPPPGDTLPAWSPDGSVIAFLSERDGLSLRVVNPDGSGENRYPWLPATATYAFSPDWTHVAAEIDRQLVVERLDGSDRLSLGTAAYAAKPSWSEDGTRVAFIAPSATPNQADVVVARIDGSEAHRVAAGYQPAWSPLDERIAYLAGPYPSNELHVVNADGSGDTKLAGGGGYTQPAWSPDATRVAIVHRRAGQFRGTLELVGVDNPPDVRFRSVFPSEYAWSPTGAVIAYSNGGGVWVLDVRSGRHSRVSAFGQQPAWSSDGRLLAFSSTGECRNRSGIYRVDVGLRRSIRLTNDCRILGSPGDDVLTGTGLADLILGEAGNDTLKGVADYWTGDTLEGGPGRDLLLGSYSGDTLDGGSGADILRGGPSADRIVGGAGRDMLQGQGGRDAIYARDGWRDVVSCGTNVGRTTGPEGDVAYVDRRDRVSQDCEIVFRPGPATPPRGRTSLSITVWPQGDRDPKYPRRQYTLRCRPAGGTLPKARAACAKLGRIQNPFALRSPAEPCTFVYAGDQVASVLGLYGGHRARARFDRQSSCGTQRWNRLAFLFPTGRS